MTRTLMPFANTYPEKYRMLPGCMPLVPDDCIRSDKVFIRDKIRWIDLGICAQCQNMCRRRKEYSAKEFHEERIRMHGTGVKIHAPARKNA